MGANCEIYIRLFENRKRYVCKPHIHNHLGILVRMHAQAHMLKLRKLLKMPSLLYYCNRRCLLKFLIYSMVQAENCCLHMDMRYVDVYFAFQSNVQHLRSNVPKMVYGSMNGEVGSSIKVGCLGPTKDNISACQWPALLEITSSYCIISILCHVICFTETAWFVMYVQCSSCTLRWVFNNTTMRSWKAYCCARNMKYHYRNSFSTIRWLKANSLGAFNNWQFFHRWKKTTTIIALLE